MKHTVRLPLGDAVRLALAYAGGKILEQARVVIPLVLYLLVFQLVVLRLPLADASIVALGVALVVLGLSFFLEGVRLSIMPLGEEVGLQLPRKAGPAPALAFGLLLGVAATLAEPAVAVLRLLGSGLSAWEAPLLFLLLNRYSVPLVLAIGGGVGVAVVLSLLRSYFDWSLKPFILVLVPTLLGLTLGSVFDANLRMVTGLAWDAGGVTTGPVTVPLVIALGLGVSRAAGRKESPGSGLGVVTLASLLPVAAVFLLALSLRGAAPSPMEAEAFFAPDNRARAEALFESREAFREYALRHGGPAGLQAAAGDDAGSPGQPEERSEGQFVRAARAVLPLSLILIFFLVVLLRGRVAHWDEVIFGILIALAGMAMLNLGIELGLARLGGSVGGRLPAAFQPIAVEETRQVIRDFDPELVQTAVTSGGQRRSFFYLEQQGRYRAVPYHPERYDPQTRTYVHDPGFGPLFAHPLPGILLVLLFALLMGYGATLAEPALNILGGTVEEITAGAFKRAWLIRVVGLGVGAGMIAGVVRLLLHVPMLWMLAPPYLLLLVMTPLSSEEFVNIGWDCAGVTTGPVTVPLIIALGLGLAGEIGVAEGFGIIALASAYPIIFVLAAGLWVGRRQRISISAEGS